MRKLIGAIILTVTAPFSYGALMNFGGDVSTSCSFSSTNSGVVEATSNGSLYKLTTLNGGGSPATIDFHYQGSPTISLEAIPRVSYSGQGVFPTHTTYTEASFQNPINEANAITSGFHGFTSGTKTMQMSNSATTDRMSINLVATADSPFPIGNISANAVITCQ